MSLQLKKYPARGCFQSRDTSIFYFLAPSNLSLRGCLTGVIFAFLHNQAGRSSDSPTPGSGVTVGCCICCCSCIFASFRIACGSPLKAFLIVVSSGSVASCMVADTPLSILGIALTLLLDIVLLLYLPRHTNVLPRRPHAGLFFLQRCQTKTNSGYYLSVLLSTKKVMNISLNF
jgi:hypothetical protein